VEIGLGKAPEKLDIVDSFLLFNTAENPYQYYRVQEKIHHKGTQQLQKAFKREDVVEGVQSPDEKVGSNLPPQDNFYHSPSTLQTPDIDVPECLPDLPGIVNDFDLGVSPLTPSFFSLTPSASSTPALSKIDTKESKKQDTNLTPQQTIKQVVVPISISSAVGPPPPPLPSTTSTAAVPVQMKTEVVKKTSSAGDDMRSSLMEAIRAAGGAGKASLRSAQERKYEAKKKRQEEKEKQAQLTTESNNGTDMMADLKNTLAMRRKGISGIQGQGKQIVGNTAGAVSDIMQRLASTIPVIQQGDSSGGVGGFGDDDDDSPDDKWDSD